MAPRRTTEQATETRDLLVQAGRDLFGADGFAATKATDVAERAGVTRGALLHHFVDKTGLFAAVLETVEQDVATHVGAVAARASSPLEGLQLGFAAFLTECLDPEMTQIMLIDGPSVLGWEVWHEIDSRYGYRPVLEAVRAAVVAGQIDSEDSESLAHLLLGALAEAGTVVGRSEDREATRDRMAGTLARLIDGLRPEMTG